MKQSDLLAKLVRLVSESEWKQLEKADNDLCIGEFNRKMMLEMRTYSGVQGYVEDSCIKGLYERLDYFLKQQMKEQPEGHKWIILVCLYLTFVVKRPMHPQEVVNYTIEEKDGKLHYYCPCKTDEENSVCDYCVAEFQK